MIAMSNLSRRFEKHIHREGTVQESKRREQEKGLKGIRCNRSGFERVSKQGILYMRSTHIVK